MEQGTRQRTLDLKRGLFLIKYASADDDEQPPRVVVSLDPGDDRVELILPPDAEEAVLWSPGASFAARSLEGGRLNVAVVPASPGGSAAAHVQLIALSHDPDGRHAETPPDALELDLSGFRVLGHVAGLGDVHADAGAWIAGPTTPSRIEGLAIVWSDMPANLALRYAVRIGGQRPTTTEPVAAGQYAGTRGRALPLVGATLEISGAAARGHQLVVDAIFLGSPQMRVTGQRVVLSGPTGREPLVGLKVNIEEAGRARLAKSQILASMSASTSIGEDEENADKSDSRPAPAAKLGAMPPRTAGKQSGRVRVFRSSKTNQP